MTQSLKKKKFRGIRVIKIQRKLFRKLRYWYATQMRNTSEILKKKEREILQMKYKSHNRRMRWRRNIRHEDRSL